MNKRFQRTATRIAAAAGVGVSSIVVAGAGFQSGTITFLHTPDLANPTQGDFDLSGTPVASGRLPSPPSYSLNRAYVVGSNTLSSARASLGHVTNSTTATVTLPKGVGITQFDPLNRLAGASSLRIALNDLTWAATSPSFGPTASGYFSMTTAGVNASGGSSRIRGQIEYRNAATNALLCNPYNFDQTINTAGAFTRTFTNAAAFFAPTVPLGTQFKLGGFIEFQTTGASFSFGPEGGDFSEVSLTEFEVGTAFPTWTYVGPNGAPGSPVTNWLSPANWRADSTTIDPALVPNGVGHRARFALPAGASRVIELRDDITLGALELIGEDGLSLTAVNSHLTFDTGSITRPAQLTVSYPSPSSVTFGQNVILNSPLEILVDNTNLAAPMIIGPTNSPMTGGAGTYVRKLGPGRMSIQGAMNVPAVITAEGDIKPIALIGTQANPGFAVEAEGFGEWNFDSYGIDAPGSVKTAFTKAIRLRDRGVVQKVFNSLNERFTWYTNSVEMPAPFLCEAKFDLGGGVLVVDYAAGGPSPFSNLRELIALGRNGGNWGGFGVTSTNAAQSPSLFAVGISETAEMFGVGSTTPFRNYTLDDSSIFIRWTTLGDANLDGMTNIADFARLAANFNQPGSWSKGDFNYDSMVNVADFSLLASLFNRQISNVWLPRESAVPEPLSGIAMMSLLAMRRRR